MAANAIATLGWQTLSQLTPAISPAAAGLFLSPLSLYIALVLVLNGAGLPSITHQQIWQVLQQRDALPPGYPAAVLQATEARFNANIAKLQRALMVQPGNGTELIIANALWTRGVQLRRMYQGKMQSLFQATVADVPSVSLINAWAAKVTNGLITQAIPPGTPFNMVITNAVYFKGQWLYAFDKAATTQQPFTTRANTKVQVPMMTKRFRNEGREARPVLYVDTPGWSGVRLPYQGGTLSAMIMLPKDPNPVTPVVPVAQALLTNKWSAPEKLDVSLPRFKVKNDLKLTAPLKNLGMVAALDPGRANFTRISANPLYITDVLQSVVVQVDEVGTAAAAVTSVVMLRASAVPRPTPQVVFNKPFLFNIVDDTTNTVLFQGWVTDPSKSVP